jgi:hypothetical protein
MTLTEFLLECIAEDEVVARACLNKRPWARNQDQRPATCETFAADWCPLATEHITRHDPSRVLVECEAKRRIVEIHSLVPDPEPDDRWLGLCDACDSTQEGYPCTTLRVLALPYADHPDYREGWRP